MLRAGLFAFRTFLLSSNLAKLRSFKSSFPIFLSLSLFSTMLSVIALQAKVALVAF